MIAKKQRENRLNAGKRQNTSADPQTKRGGYLRAYRIFGFFVLFGAMVSSMSGFVYGGETNLPVRWDAREEGKMPVVKDQGTLGTCWALCAVSALEAYALPETQVSYSADHLSLNNGFVLSQQEGGDYKMIMAYLSGWYGPVLEEEDPYGDGETVDGLTACAHVQEMVLMRGKTRQEYKEMLLSHGPFQTSLAMNLTLTEPGQQIYNEDTYGYYDPQSDELDHEVLLIGWDDTYPAENFSTLPEGDGAWICQNTWGEDFGDQGIFYVSYYDANMAQRGLAYTRVENADSTEHIYQSDVCGWQAQQGYGQEDCYFANVFTASSAQSLTGVGFYSTRRQTDYAIFLVSDFADETSFAARQLLQLGTIEELGYFTIDLTEEIPLEEGERFAIAVYIRSEEALRPVAVEMKKDAETALVTTEGKEGYLSADGETWENTEEQYGTNVCLKAYTRDR